MEQKAIIDYLRLNGWFVYKNNNIGIYNKKTGSYIPAQTKGIPDLTCIKDSQVYQIEVKINKNKQSDNQKSFQGEWESKGGVYIIGDLDDVIKAIK